MKVASVLIPLPVQEAFDYEVPETLDLVRGDAVLGDRERLQGEVDGEFHQPSAKV